MKKIIIVALSLFVLVSCGVENKVETKKEVIKKDVIKKVDTNSGGELRIGDVQKSLAKLKDIEIDSTELEMINLEILSKYTEKVELDALSNKDIKICDKLDKDNIDSCKKRFFVANNDIESCNLLKVEDVQRACKNSIIEKEASKNFDEKLCEKMTFQKQENSELEKSLVSENGKEEIKNCKNRILIEKAISKNNSNICNNINGENEKDNCIELVKREIENERLIEETNLYNEDKKIK